jgi:F-type H+-transporting ATPase subunit O
MATRAACGLVRQFSTSAVGQQLAKPPVQVFGLQGRYASALYSAAVKEKKLDTVEKELVDLQKLFKTDKVLDEFLRNPTIPRGLKVDAVTGVMGKKKVSELTKNFFLAVADNGRLAKVDGFIDAFRTIMAAVRGEVICEIVTAKPLDAAQQKDVEATLKSFLKAGQVIKLKSEVDPAIVGGMIVTVGDKYIDMSISTKLKLYTDLINQPI